MQIIRRATDDSGLSADEAMTRYAGGDDEAFGRLYAAVTPTLAGFLRHRVRDGARIPDLIQETFLRVHRARRTFLPGAPAMPWILTIARHLAADAHRAPAREEGADIEVLDRLSQRSFVGVAATGEQMLIAEEVAVRLGNAFEHLPEGQRAALRLVKSEGLSIAEAAAALGTTTTGVKLRTHKACRKLRAVLEPELVAA
ncbi:MAG TPA: RNA polymerase sigma factor [Polyangia bacterium]|nr:RNA polymerase sigma factor [Polyangia bacterium]